MLKIEILQQFYFEIYVDLTLLGWRSKNVKLFLYNQNKPQFKSSKYIYN